MARNSGEITGLLKAWSRGDRAALDQLTPLVYDQLKQLAGGYLRREREGHTLQTTALVHEAYLRLAQADELTVNNRLHFFAVCARVMRRILVDHARRRASAKRGGGVIVERETTEHALDNLPSVDDRRAVELLALDEALTALAAIDSRRAEVVEHRFFGGLSVDETAKALNVSPQTVMRDWRLARAWLTRELQR